nr:hypothetical protein [Enterococcus faecium]
MNADFARIPWEVLQKISVRIVNEVAHVNRIVYDITANHCNSGVGIKSQHNMDEEYL